jgi:hypothetical protein
MYVKHGRSPLYPYNTATRAEIPPKKLNLASQQGFQNILDFLLLFLQPQ